MKIKQILQTVPTMSQTLSQPSQTLACAGLAVRTGVCAGAGERVAPATATKSTKTSAISGDMMQDGAVQGY